jgi:hypothetical protein
MKTIVSMQLALHFHVATSAVGPDDFDAAGIKIHLKAYELIASRLLALPAWTELLDNKGLPTTSPNGVRVARAELCEPGFEFEAVNGKPVFSIWFQRSGIFPLDLAQALRPFCLAQYKEAAGEVQVQFAKAQRNKYWHESETLDWVEV